MLARTLSAAVLGVDAYLVRVEVDVASGLPSFTTVGLPQGAVREGKERVVAAVKNSGFFVPSQGVARVGTRTAGPWTDWRNRGGAEADC